MEKQKLLSRYPVSFCILGMGIGWFAVIAQFYLFLGNRTASIPETIIRYFSFFTILTNILVTVSFTIMVFRPGSRLGNFFLRPATLTAIAVYISIVCIIYNLFLRSLWNPYGWQRLADELLHSVIPVMFVLFWILHVPKDRLTIKNVRGWLIYPLTYLAFILVRGALSGFYPYPFVDVPSRGYPRIVVNILILLAGFIIFSIILILIGKLYGREKNE